MKTSRDNTAPGPHVSTSTVEKERFVKIWKVGFFFKRKRADCPLCPTKNLKRLPNHLAQHHGLVKGTEKTKILDESKNQKGETRKY
jgi:hypothetical protein